MIRDTSWRVRPCEIVDAAALCAIRLEALRDTPQAYGSTYDQAVTWSHHQWVRAAAERNYYLAERDGVVVGMVSGGPNESHPGTHWMYGMYVSPDVRGSGIAQLLVDEVSEWARGEGASALFLHVTASLTRARSFYEKAGFHLTGGATTMGRDPAVGLVEMAKYL